MLVIQFWNRLVLYSIGLHYKAIVHNEDTWATTKWGDIKIQVMAEPTETSTQDLKNVGKTSYTQKTNLNSLNMSLRKDMK